MEEPCEAGLRVITGLLFVYQAKHNVSQWSTYACSASHLQGRSERRHQLAQSSMSQMISALFLFFFYFILWHIILLCLTWSPFTVSLLLVSSGSGSYSNPFLHASDRLILSLLSCCSTWQRIRPGTPFAFQVIHNLCTFVNFTKPCKNQTVLASSLLSNSGRRSGFPRLVANIYLIHGLKFSL